MNRKKYVRLTYVGFVLFNEQIPHANIKLIADQGGYHIISAGFWDIGDDGKATCFGESIGLGVKSRPDDTEELRTFLGQTD